MERCTEALRRSAPQWRLAGDKELLDALQTLHQRIMEKCQETNRKLDEMVTALDDASVHLQNVNNKFTALSNSQFIESRVYDDDMDVIPDTVEKKEQPNPSNTDTEMDSLQRSLQILEDFHETVTILCDSDSDESDDDENVASIVLKPRDLYSSRPLPHIIGTQAWKSKWHAGLLPDDDSDTNSDNSKNDLLEQYSDSEPEPQSEYLHPPARGERTISSSSSDLHSEQDIPTTLPPTGIKPTQSDIAAELARRLGGGTQKIPEQETEYPPEEPITRKVYKPEKPAAGQVFIDEPPPLETDQSEESDQDIFAQINKNQPYKQNSREQSAIADDLFGKPIFDDVGNTNSVVKQKSPLFEDDSEPDLFVEKPKPSQDTRKQEDVVSKKPKGGMSMFGSNAESIGAAILKRNQLQASTSDDESDDNRVQIANNRPQTKNMPQDKSNEVKQVTKEDKVKETLENKNQRDIFDDLFAKSEKINKNKEQEKIKTEMGKKSLFSGNLFDDMDDMFSTTTTKVRDSKNERSIFDDDDDLFADVAVVQNVTKNNNTTKTIENKNIFGSDEDLFTEKQNKKEVETKSTDNNLKVDKLIKESKSVFDDDDDDLFSDVSVPKNILKPKEVTEDVMNINKSTESNDSSHKVDDLFHDNNEDYSLFSKSAQKEPAVLKAKPKLTENESNLRIKEKIIKSSIISSPNLFDDDENDDLFSVTPSKSIPETDKIMETNNETSESNEFSILHNETVANKIVNDEINKVVQNEKLINSNLEVTPKPNLTSKPSPQKDSIIDKNLQNKDQFSEPNSKTDILNTQETSTKVLKSIKTDDIFNSSEEEDAVFKTTKLPNKPKIATKPNVIPNTATKGVDTVIPVIRPDSSPIIETENAIATSKSEIVDEVLDSKPPVLKSTNNMDTKSHQQDSVLNDVYKSESNVHERVPPEIKADIFTDIFNDQPPDFEKPKEPKKSKNINALFDDDSDDEALFFKKNDATLDEKPELFSSPVEDRLFDLFIDEPPAIEVDLVPKPTETSEIPVENDRTFVREKCIDNLDQQSVKKEVSFVEKSNIIEDSDDFVEKSTSDDFKNKSQSDTNYVKLDETSKTDSIFGSKEIQSLPRTDSFDTKQDRDIFSNTNDELFFNKSDNLKISFDDNDGSCKNDFDSLLQNDDNLFKTVKPKIEANKIDIPNRVSNEPQNIEKETNEHKKVGKLKPMNFNINVNTLLPGASPKKVAKPNEQTDGQAISTKSNEELRSNEDLDENFESKLVKSVSFEGKSDSTILDNKLSKERVKIQVKRRPSTRRARREAVKKSGIDFGEDTTDNSSSYDDPPKSPTLSTNTEKNKLHYDETESAKQLSSPTEVSISSKYEREVDEFSSITNDFDDLFKPKNDITSAENIVKDMNSLKEENLEKSSYVSVKDSLKTENIGHSISDLINKDTDQVNTEKYSQTQNVSTEISSPNHSDVKSKVVYVLNDEDIFDTVNTKLNKSVAESLNSDDDDAIFKTVKPDENLGISTIGKVYRETTTKPEKSDKKLQIIDDDRENLFKEIKTKSVQKQSIFDSDDDTELFTKRRDEKPKKNVLFSSDSDEELFGKSKSKVKERSVEKETKRVERSVEKEIKRVEVKGSLFGDDDDENDLFGVKPKKNIEQILQPSKVDTSKDTVKSAEPVFQDPLSLLEDDDD